MLICDENKCTGCGACVNLCPTDSIKMKENIYGEIHPEINEQKCVKCKKCVRLCPSNLNPVLSEPKKVYAGWRKEDKFMRDSASGGIGAVLAENWVRLNGIVFGTKYDSDFCPHIKAENSLEGIEGFKGSKYIQSNTRKSFREAKKYLEEGKKVLFIGTPCQLAGLYTVCDRENPNLITVEILCHGVAPEKYFHEELEYIERNAGISTYDNVTFRTNRWMMDFYFGLWNKNKIVYSEQAYENYYFRGFLTGLTLRESCYSCQYKNSKRIGDIMIGDFIGFGVHIPYEGESKRPSLIIATNEKGVNYIKSCEKDIVLVERTIEEAMIDGRSLREPFPRHEKQKIFRDEYRKNGYIEAIENTINDEIKLCKKNNRVMHIKRKIKFFLSDFFNIKIQNGKVYHEE